MIIRNEKIKNTLIWDFIRLHRCWWRMLEIKCVGDKFGFWWQGMSSISRLRHQHQVSVTYITFWLIMKVLWKSYEGELFTDKYGDNSLEKFASNKMHTNSRLTQIMEIIKIDEYNYIMLELGIFSAVWKCLGFDSNWTFQNFSEKAEHSVNILNRKCTGSNIFYQIV